MAPQDGIEVARAIRGRGPVIFLTAYGDRELILAAAEAGAYAHVIKPIVESELLAPIQLAQARAGELSKAIQALEGRKVIERAKGVLSPPPVW